MTWHRSSLSPSPPLPLSLHASRRESWCGDDIWQKKKNAEVAVDHGRKGDDVVATSRHRRSAHVVMTAGRISNLTNIPILPKLENFKTFTRNPNSRYLLQCLTKFVVCAYEIEAVSHLQLLYRFFFTKLTDSSSMKERMEGAKKKERNKDRKRAKER